MLKRLVLPKVLPINPMTLTCPRCKAKLGSDCKTTSGDFSALHVARIKAAAALDARK
jgi:hypothetical protein